MDFVGEVVADLTKDKTYPDLILYPNELLGDNKIPPLKFQDNDYLS